MRFAIFAFVFAVSCKQVNTSEIQRSFFYWKSVLYEDTVVSNFVEKENIDHLYIRYMDVVWDDLSDGPVPAAKLYIPSPALTFGREISPVIFISNECMAKMDDYWLTRLPQRLAEHLVYISRRVQPVDADSLSAIREIQIDCDWTPLSKEKYFTFLKNFKALHPDKIISVTLRLYPYKYRKTMGIPPVDKALLMCYNLSPIQQNTTVNSIFAFKDLEQYLDAPAYPIQLDVALPVFGWYAGFRNEKFLGIMYPGTDKLSVDDYNDLSNGKRTLLRMKRDRQIGNFYLKTGDMVRVEYPDPEDLIEAYRLLMKKIPCISRVAFFHLDRDNIERYEKVIHQIYSNP